MATIEQVFGELPERFLAGAVSTPRTYYFAVGDLEYTVRLCGERCVVERGKTLERADCTVRVTPELFNRILDGGLPGPGDIARGRIRTDHPLKLVELKRYFRLDPD